MSSVPTEPAKRGQVGPCCALKFCAMKTTKLADHQHRCRKCRGYLHSFLCAVPDSGENEWMMCLLCHHSSQSSTGALPPSIITQSPLGGNSVSGDQQLPPAAAAACQPSPKQGAQVHSQPKRPPPAPAESVLKHARKRAKTELDKAQEELALLTANPNAEVPKNALQEAKQNLKQAKKTLKRAKRAHRQAKHARKNASPSPSAICPSLSAIRADFDDCKNKPWASSVPFQGHLCSPSDPCPPAGHPSFKQELDLFALTECEHSTRIFRFDPGQFPRGTQPFAPGNHQLRLLMNALSSKCSLVGDFSLIGNGHRGGLCRMFCCRFRPHKPKPGRPTAPGKLRIHSLNRDKSNQRKGKSKRESLKWVRGKSTQRPIPEKGECNCTCSLALSADSGSFFMVCGLGSGTHQGHLPLSQHERSVNCSHSPEQVKEMAMQCAVAGVGPGATARLLHNIHGGLTLNRRGLARHAQTSKLALTVAGAELFQSQKGSKGDVDIIFDHLKETKQICTALFHRIEESGCFGCII